jgi:hypothetical protein
MQTQRYIKKNQTICDNASYSLTRVGDRAFEGWWLREPNRAPAGHGLISDRVGNIQQTDAACGSCTCAATGPVSSQRVHLTQDRTAPTWARAQPAPTTTSKSPHRLLVHSPGPRLAPLGSRQAKDGASLVLHKNIHAS